MSGSDHLSALLSTFDTAAPAITVLRVASGVRMIGPPADGVVALLVLAGRMHLDVEGEAPRVVEQGRVALVPARRQARLAATAEVTVTVEGRQCLTRRKGWLVADATRGREAALIVGAGRIAGTGPEALLEPLVSEVVKCRIGKPLFTLLRAECLNEIGEPALANALMNACVVQGLRRAIDRNRSGPATETGRYGIIANAISAIRSRPGERHTTDTLAKAAGMSRSSFIRHFTRLMRMGPAEYAKQVRLEEARTMLETTQLPIKTIAGHTGFRSRSHFSRAFRAAFGIDPSSYRAERPTDFPN